MEIQPNPNPKTVHASRKDLFCLLSFLEDQLPTACDMHLFVHSALITADPAYAVYFRRDDTIDQYLVIVGIKVNPTVDPNKKTIVFSTWVKDNEEAALVDTLKTLDVNWKDNSIMMYYKGSGPHATLSNFFIASKEGELTEVPVWPCYQYFIPIEDALNYELKKIDDVYVKSLERCHAQQVYDHWPHKLSALPSEIADEISQLPSAGVFLKDTDELVAWIMCHENYTFMSFNAKTADAESVSGK